MKRFRRSKAEKRRKKGFSLVEMLAVLLIMAMLAVMVSTSVSAAVTAYQKNIFVSESEVLSSTINTAMSDILCYAKYVSQTTDDKVVFINAAYHIVDGGHFFLDDDGRVCYLLNENNPENATRLINSRAYTSLYLRDLEISFSKDPSEKQGSYSGVFHVTYTICSRLLPGAEKNVSCSFRSLIGDLADIG